MKIIFAWVLPFLFAALSITSVMLGGSIVADLPVWQAFFSELLSDCFKIINTLMIFVSNFAISSMAFFDRALCLQVRDPLLI
jgi:hypothetical protein